MLSIILSVTTYKAIARMPSWIFPHSVRILIKVRSIFVDGGFKLEQMSSNKVFQKSETQWVLHC